MKISQHIPLGSRMDVTIAILNWNGRELLATYLPEVLANTPQSCEVLVADNGSTDDSLAWLAKHYPQVRTLEIAENLGYAGGYNKVMEHIETTYVVLLNSDVAPQAGWVQPVIHWLETHTNAAAAQGKIRDHKDPSRFEYAGAAGGFADTLGYMFCQGRLFDDVEVDQGQYDQPREIFWASGAALFIRRDVFFEAGGLDHRFFAHMEEIDLCWRIRNLGYAIGYVPESVVYHLGGGSLSSDSPRKLYLNFRNNMFMLLKNLPRRQWWVIPVRLALDMVAALQMAIGRGPKFGLAVLKAQLHVLWYGPAYLLRRSKRRNATDHVGRLRGSVIWQYFAKKRKTFTALRGLRDV